MSDGLGKILIQLGIILVVSGAIIHFGGKFLPFGNLPGDIRIEGEHGGFYFPWVSCIIISVVLSVLSYLFR